MTAPSTVVLQQLLDRLRSGDPAAQEELLRRSSDRLRLLTSKMLDRYPGVRRWEETDDVFQNVLVRLDRMLQQLTVGTVRDYLRLAATQIRRELIDLARHRRNLVERYVTPRPGNGPDSQPPVGPADSSGDPARLAGWAEIHEQISLLPDEEREAFDLHWYQGLLQDEAAELLGVSLSTFKRRWQSARLKLMEALGGELPF
jgi:RNA polymerase sigma factor (sigma-70 family)